MSVKNTNDVVVAREGGFEPIEKATYVPEYARIYRGLKKKDNWLGLAALLRKHLLRQAPAYILLAMFMAAFHANYRLGWNFSESLPGHLFITHINEPPVKGGMVAFHMHKFEMYAEGSTFVKIVRGIAGDRVDEKNGVYYVNMNEVGKAKPFSKKGKPLEKGPTGIIPDKYFYVAGTHKDSFDSRYAGVGWISQDRIVGRAYVLF